MQSTGQTMLLVENVPADIELASQALRICGHADRIRVVRDGLEALDYLFAEGDHAGRDRSLQPAAVLLELKLPRLSGFDVLARVHSDPRTFRTPIVIHTDSKDDFDINRAYELGASSYVFKHGDFVQYCTTLKKITDYWLQVNIPPVPPRFRSVRTGGRRK